MFLLNIIKCCISDVALPTNKETRCMYCCKLYNGSIKPNKKKVMQNVWKK